MFNTGGVFEKMEVKRMVKRLFAVGTGVAMLGATAMGALAADLGNYPGMFVSDGTFDGYLVVGENAKPIDNLAMTDIATSMKVASTTGTTTTTIEGDAWEVESGTDKMEFTESIGPSGGGVVDFMDNDDLAALADGSLKNSLGTFKYEQFIHFDKPVVNITYEEDEDDVTALFLKVLTGQPFARYELDFLEAAESDIDSSDSYELDDFKGKTITFLGKTFNIVSALSDLGGDKVSMILMAGSVADSLLEGETKTYDISSIEYEVALSFTDSNDRAKFTVNGETTNLMEEGETFTLADGTVLGLSEVLYQNYAGGIHSADFYLGADKITIEDDAINTSTSTDQLKVNAETIDGADIWITGANLDNADSATEDGKLEIDSIEINMTSQDDYFIGVGETLLGQPELDEKDLVFTQNWDLRFEGMADVATSMISVKDKSGEKAYELTFTNTAGNEIKVPIAYATAATSARAGDQNDRLLWNTTNIGDEQFFILNDDTDEDSVTNLIQYKGANVGSEETKLKFKILGTGETVERTANVGASTVTGTLKLSGTTFSIANTTLGSADNFNISVTGGQQLGVRLGTGWASNKFFAKGGAVIHLVDHNASVDTNGLFFNISLIDSDMTNDVIDATGNGIADNLPYIVFGANINASSTEVDMTQLGGMTVVSPDDDEDNSYAYSANGAWIKYNSPSGSGANANTLEVDWPTEMRKALVYVTSGATATTTAATAGDLVPVTVVDATKLDSEVASAGAQNLIVVGGPCVNTVAAELLGNPADCTEGFTPGKARIKLVESGTNVAMLVAGYSGADTRLAGKVIAHRAGELSGEEVEVEGTTYSDATIGRPSPVAAAPVVEEAAEEATE